VKSPRATRPAAAAIVVAGFGTKIAGQPAAHISTPSSAAARASAAAAAVSVLLRLALEERKS
jgi:hypothetical protein